MKNGVLFILLFASLLTGCKKSALLENEYISCADSVSYVFPHTLFTLDKRQGVQVLPNQVMRNFIIYDSLMIIETGRKDRQIDIVSRDSGQVLFSFLSQGNGNDETTHPITFASWTSFYHKNDSLYCNIFDAQRKRMLKANLTKSVHDKQLCVTRLFPDIRFGFPAFWTKTIGDSIVVCKSMDHGVGQHREIHMNSVQISNAAVDKMNRIRIPEGEDVNVLSSMMVTHPDGYKLAEIMLGMNYLNIYSVDGTYRRTICVESEIDKLSDILATPRERRKYYFANAKAYDFGFAVLKYNITNLQYQENSDYIPSILIFDWAGNALGEIKSNFKFIRFEIDMDNKQIYVLDDNDRLMRFVLNVKFG